MMVKNKMSSEIKIFVATHKTFKPPEIPIYIPIQVGANPQNLGYLRETQQDNIAYKNPAFCELTALYFIWKNIDVPIVGLVHYRRYFALFKTIYSLSNLLRLIKHKPLKQKFVRLLNEDDIQQILMQHDCIVPILSLGKTNLREHYTNIHHIQDWDCVKNIIKQMYPDYFSTLERIEQDNHLNPYNMFIGKKEVMDNYCKWLFSILFEAEKFIDTSTYNNYNRRVFGFLAERLFTVWVDHNQEKYRFYPQCVYFDNSI